MQTSVDVPVFTDVAQFKAWLLAEFEMSEGDADGLVALARQHFRHRVQHHA